MSKRLYRARSGKKIAGVCAGLAEYFNMDVSLVRVLFVVLCAAGGAACLAYIVLWAVAPVAPESSGSPPA